MRSLPRHDPRGRYPPYKARSLPDLSARLRTTSLPFSTAVFLFNEFHLNCFEGVPSLIEMTKDAKDLGSLRGFDRLIAQHGQDGCFRYACHSCYNISTEMVLCPQIHEERAHIRLKLISHTTTPLLMTAAVPQSIKLIY